jgi:superfamily II DNA or RNA helicase
MLPTSLLSEEQKNGFIDLLTYVSPFENEDGSRKTIRQYHLSDSHIGVPKEWLLKHYPAIYALCADETVTPGEFKYARLPTSDHPSVKKPEAQQAFMDDLLRECQTHNNVLAYAATGSGKTVVSLKVAAQLGYRTLVLVDSNNLKLQWIEEIKAKLGVDDDQIGIIQQDDCDYEGKSIVVGMLQTFARREYSEDVYNAFGTVIVDECHKISTEYFSVVLPRFNARYRIGLSATPRRKDGSDVVLYNHLSSVRVHASTEVMPVKVLVKNYYSKRKLWGKDERQRLMCLAKDPDRNELIVKYIKALYEGNRNIVVASHTVEHVEHLMFLSKKAGIPFNKMGQFTATKCVKDDNGKIIGKRNNPAKDIEEAKNKQIMFVTYNFFREAVDIPRLDAGIEALPDWKAAQILGRIRRYKADKLFPKWITLRDMKCDFSQKMYYSRIKEVNDCGGELVQIS